MKEKRERLKSKYCDFWISYGIILKKEENRILYEYMDYIANSKNRKFKKQIHGFIDRINFGAEKLPVSGRFILMLTFILGLSLFFPWLEFEYLNGDTESYSAFSGFTWYIGYGIILWLIIIPFFLLSHSKKERIRAHVPFRLSDTQLIVFISSMILTSLLHLISMVSVFWQFTTGTNIGKWFLIAISSICCIIISAFFLSKKIKEESIELRHIDHKEVDLSDEYTTILWKKVKKDNQEDSNMVLPI